MKNALVTGGNRGLGLETVKQLIDEGFFVYLGTRNTEKTDDIEAYLNGSTNYKIIELDVLKNDHIRNFLSMLRDEKKSLDVLVNNAGVFLESDGPQDQSTSSVFKVDPVIVLKTIETNTISALKMIQFVVPHMQLHGGGRVINVSSGMGQLEGMSGHWPGYRMSKTAMNALTKIVADEAGDSNIFINSVSPGWVKTDMGGDNAFLTVEQGVESIIWLATVKDSPQGKFIQEKREIRW